MPSVLAPIEAMESIYRRVAGPAFDHLPEAVKRAHGVPLSARGEVDVRWSDRRTTRLVGRAMGLPPEGTGMPLRLEVSADGERVVYDRWFGGHHLRTVQDVHRGWLREKVGAAALLYRLEADAERLMYRTVGSRLLGVPLPGIAGASVTAAIEARDGGWRARIEVRSPLLGKICEYEARMEIR